MNLQQAKDNLRRKGMTITAWAKANGYKPSVAIQVLNGQKKGNYGEPHRIAVALGLKSDEVDELARGQ